MLGHATAVTDETDKLDALEALAGRLLPGRWPDVRPPTTTELKATSILRLPLTEASAKVRTGPPQDNEEDYLWPVWAGVIPVRLVAGPPEPDHRLGPGLAPPVWAPTRNRA